MTLEIPSLTEIKEELEREKQKRTRRHKVWMTVFSLAVVASVTALAASKMPAVQISGNSMADTLHDRDIAIACKKKAYEAGDVIAFQFKDSLYVKRIIAVPGDTVDMDSEGNVYVNNHMLDEPYIHEKSLGECDIVFPCIVPEGKLFVLGDHREVSIDSRNSAVGLVDQRMIVGKIFARIWPIQHSAIIK